MQKKNAMVKEKSSKKKARKRKSSSDNSEQENAKSSTTSVRQREAECSGNEYKVPPKQYLKWHPIDSSTMSAVNTVMDSNIKEVLHLCSSRSYQEIQQHLENLKQRVNRKLGTLKAPVSKEDYSELENNVVLLEDSLSETAAHIQLLQREMQQTERLLGEGEEEENKLRQKLVVAETKLRQQEGAGQRDAGNVLKLPALSTQRGRKSGNDRDLIHMLESLPQST